jgi:putative membrane protein
MLLSKQEQQQINELAQQFETRSGAQVVAAVIGKADDYPDIPWKAFALGAALAALAVVADELVRPDWASIHTPVRDVALILATGIICTILAITVPWFARFFLNRERAKTEVRQYAQGLFLQREIFKTAERVGILVLVCRFEHKIVILPDTGITRHVSAQELDSVIAAMAAPLKRGDAVQAFQVGFDALATLITEKGIRPSGYGNELADGAVVEQGS